MLTRVFRTRTSHHAVCARETFHSRSIPRLRSFSIRALLDPKHLKTSLFSLSLYGDPAKEVDDLKESIRAHGILVPLVVAPGTRQGGWEVISGHRRLACALALDLEEVPCQVRLLRTETARRQAILEYNRQRRKSFTQLMREADALEDLWRAEARNRRLANLRQSRFGESDRNP